MILSLMARTFQGSTGSKTSWLQKKFFVCKCNINMLHWVAGWQRETMHKTHKYNWLGSCYLLFQINIKV